MYVAAPVARSSTMVVPNREAVSTAETPYKKAAVA
jgi:hypothetical protein